MKKFINLRLPLFFALLLMAGGAVGYFIKFYNVNGMWLTATAFAVAVSLILCFIAKGASRRAVICSLCALCFFIGAFNTVIRFGLYQSSDIVNGGTYEVVGVAESREEAEEGAYVTIGSLTVNGRRTGGKIYAFLHEKSGDYCDAGYRVRFTASLQREEAFPYGRFNTYAAYGVKYRCFVYYGVTAEKTFAPFSFVNCALRDALYRNLDPDIASVACAMLTGNTSGVDGGVLNSFRYGGIAHIFAVSGLHVGLVYAAVYALLKKCRANKYAVAGVSSLTVFLYAGVCGFAASSLRAAVMCTVGSACKLSHQKYDGLNAMSLAALLLLLYNPLWLFTVGFQLSFGAVASIFLLAHSFQKLFAFLPKKLSSSLAVTFSVQAGTLPVMLSGFGYISVAGLLLNPLFIPVLSFLYVLLFFGTLLSLVIPPLGAFVLPFASAPLALCLSALNSVGWESAAIRAGGLGIVFVLYLSFIALLSLRINLKVPVRAAVSSAAGAAMAALVCLAAFSPLSGTNLIVCANYNGQGVLVQCGGKSLIVLSEDSAARFAESTVDRYCFRPPEVAVILGSEKGIAAVSSAISRCQSIYLSDENIEVSTYGGAIVSYVKSFSFCGVNFSFADSDSLLLSAGGVSVGIAMGENTSLTECNLLVAALPQKSVNCENTVYFSLKDYKFNVYDCGDLHFFIKNDTIKRKGLLPRGEGIFQ